VSRKEGHGVVFGLATLLLALAVAPTSRAATYHVTQKSDGIGACDAHCTLREAMMAANGTLADDRVKVPKGTYMLSIGSPDTFSGCAGDADWGDLDICPEGGALKLVGAGAGRTIVDAAGIDRVIEVVSDSGAGPDATISGVTITGGRSPDEGGGLSVDGNRSTTVVRSVIRGNRTVGPPGNAPDGAGIVNRPTFPGAQELVLRKDTVRGNSTGDGGDGAGLANEGLIAIRASTISGNVAHSESNDGDGAGLNNAGALARATILNSTFSGNRAGSANSSDGGAIYTDGDLTLLNSTIALNKAESGGGIAAVNRPENTQTIENSILARNAIFAGGTENCGGFVALVSLGHNLEQGTSCGFAGPGDIHGHARLRPLADNGGPTKTHALRRRSKAINRGKNADCTSTDQRGVRRPQGKRCDIGAYELKKRKHHRA